MIQLRFKSMVQDFRYIEKVKRIYLDIYDELTQAHLEKSERTNVRYPSLSAIQQKFPFPVERRLLQEIRKDLLASGEIAPSPWGKPSLRPVVEDVDLLKPVVDDPQEVAEWDPILRNAHQYRILPEGPKPRKGRRKVSYASREKRTHRVILDDNTWRLLRTAGGEREDCFSLDVDEEFEPE